MNWMELTNLTWLIQSGTQISVYRSVKAVKGVLHFECTTCHKAGKLAPLDQKSKRICKPQ